MTSRYYFGFVPRPDRSLPRPWTDWLRLFLVAALVFVASGVAVFKEDLHRLVTCNDGWPDTAAWSAGGECVGLSDAPYDFEHDAFAPALHVIDEQNRAAADRCAPDGTPVVVGVLMTMTDRETGGRAVHELEGIAAGQRRANGTGCLHPMRLVVANIGAYGEDNDGLEVAQALADRPDVVAVAGLGLSRQRSAEIADLLAGAKIPMVSDLITAEGFDQTGSAADHPAFDTCSPDITYSRGIGKDYFYRVAYRNSVQIDRLAKIITARPDFVMVPNGGSDPYTCTSLPMVQRRFGDVTKVRFDADEASTVPQTAKRLCSSAKDVTVMYIARGRDLARLLFSIDEAFSSGQCAATSVTVVSTSDGERIRAQEDNPALEDLRGKALRAPSLANGRLRALMALVPGADRQRADNPGFADLVASFTEAGFDAAHLDDGWGVNAYDSVTTISEALRTLPANRPVQRSEVNTAISGFSSVEQAVRGAGGPITFDNSGNRVDDHTPVVRICPVSTRGDQPLRARTLPAEPGAIPPC
ncbi:ABC transporter substrate-binding protein [Amycolatopsis sp. CA-230715]|uniref:ABC transporter substrate-binding protein n=1 Tax=Amycolatopsis sp. CA-230715 TaxID=2745196 RepID=UPI001C0363E3|nr:ABC transporter substrate-binding protein [Amycolatopsis sp. CA-230715]QWF84004.1 hypothetical protein HUW46_07448 [Amycolatopsis sp. CA-230715]